MQDDRPGSERVVFAILAVLTVLAPVLTGWAFTKFAVLKWEVLSIGLVAVVCAGLAMCRIPARLPSLRWAAPFLVLAACVVLSSVRAHNRHDAIQWGFRLCVLVGTFAVVRQSEMNAGRIRRLLRLSVMVALFVVFFGLACAAVAPGPADPYEAMFPTFGNPNRTAQYLVSVMPAALAMIALASSRAAKVFWGIAAAVIAAFLVATGARGAYIGALAGAAAFAVFTTARRRGLTPARVKKTAAIALAAALVLGGAVAFFAIPRMLESEQEMIRPHVWKVALRMLASNPVFGVGPGNFAVRYGVFGGYGEGWTAGSTFRVQYAHNDYIDFAVQYGLLGAIALGWIVLRPILALLGSGGEGKSEKESPAAAAVLGAVIGILVHAAVSFPLHMPAPAFAFWLNLGFIGVLAGRPAGGEGRQVKLAPRPLWAAICVACAVAASVMPFRFLVSDFYLARAKRALRVRKEALRADYRELAEGCVLSADADLDSALAWDVNNRAAWFQKGVCLTARRNYSSAVAAYERTISLLPGYHVPHYNLGMVYLRMEQPRKADEQFRRALEICPAYELPGKALARE